MRPIDAIIAILCAATLALQLASAVPRLRQPAPCRLNPPQAGRWAF